MTTSFIDPPKLLDQSDAKPFGGALSLLYCKRRVSRTESIQGRVRPAPDRFCCKTTQQQLSPLTKAGATRQYGAFGYP